MPAWSVNSVVMYSTSCSSVTVTCWTTVPTPLTRPSGCCTEVMAICCDWIPSCFAAASEVDVVATSCRICADPPATTPEFFLVILVAAFFLRSVAVATLPSLWITFMTKTFEHVEILQLHNFYFRLLFCAASLDPVYRSLCRIAHSNGFLPENLDALTVCECPSCIFWQSDNRICHKHKVSRPCGCTYEF